MLVVLATVAALATAAVVGGSPVVPAEDALAQRAERPNVVVIMTDDQEASSLSTMAKVTRHLRRRGTTFANSFATFPLCCPSRASFLTGQYAHNHGVLTNREPEGGYAGFDDRGSLPVALGRAGYRTGFVGKYLNGYARTRRPEIPRGWDRWFGAYGKRAVKMFDHRLYENGRVRQYGARARDYQTDVFARKAQEFIRQSAQGRQPYFLTLATGAPHSEGRPSPNPRPAPRHRGEFRRAKPPQSPSFNERDVSDKPFFVRRKARIDRGNKRAIRASYRDRVRSLQAVDDAVGRIVKTLRRAGDLDNTLIVFTSDNGFMLGEHRLRSKEFLYEESVQVPFVMRGPGIPGGATRRQVTGNIDLAPTIFDLTGARPLREQDGISLLPLARDSGTAADRDMLLENHESSAVRTPRYMYAEHPGGERELYDLQRDPFQLESMHAGGPHERADSRPLEQLLSQRLRRLEDCAGTGCR